MSTTRLAGPWADKLHGSVAKPTPKPAPTRDEYVSEWAKGNDPGFWNRSAAARLCRIPVSRLRSLERRGIVTAAIAFYGSSERGFTRADLDTICAAVGHDLIPPAYAPYVRVDQHYQFGSPTLIGTRLPTWCCTSGWAIDDEEFTESYPEIPIEALHAARAYEAMLAERRPS